MKKRRRAAAVESVFDFLGRRSTLRILWALRDGPMTFRSLQAAAGGVSPTLLSARLKEATAAGITAQEPAGYALSTEGYALISYLEPLVEWAETRFCDIRF